MNKIYKVIWSKAKHTYVVASEIAKGHTKGETTGKGLKKLAATMLVAAALLSPSFAWAADATTKFEPAADQTSTTAVAVYTKNEADSTFATIDQLQADVSATNAELAKKANQADLDETNDNLAKKANQTDLDATNKNLAKKANQTDLDATNENLAKKANQTDLDATNENLAKKADKATTLEGYGITDAYTKTETDSKFATVDQLQADVAATNLELAKKADKATTLVGYGITDAYTKDEVDEADNKLQSAIEEEARKRKYSVTNLENADKALDTRITNVKEYLENQTADKYVSKDDAAVQDGAVVKAANTIGDNVTKLDAALAKETAARIGADKAQDKVIQQVNQNMVEGFNTINKNMADGFTALNNADLKEAQERAAADAAETAGRVAADTKLVEAVNGGLSLGNGNVLQTNKTSVKADGTVSTSKEAATTLVMNEGKDNQITLSENGIKVGKNSGVMDKDGFYAGGDNADAAAAALKADGSIKGAKGNFTVDGTTGDVNTKGSVTAASGTIGNVSMSADGTVTGVKDLTASGKVTADSFTDGTATMSNGSLNGVNQINATGNIVTTGDMQAHDMTATGTITGQNINGTSGTFGSLTTTGNASVGGTLTANGINNTGNTTTDSLTVKQGATVGGNLAVTGDITGKSLNVGTGDIKGGQITGTGLDVGAGTIKTTGAVETGTLTTSGNADIGGNLTVDKNLTVNGEFNAKTLSSKLDENNYTTINGGNVTSVNVKVDTDAGRTYTSSSKLTEKGRTDTAGDGTTLNKSTQTASESGSTISSLADEKQKSYITQNLKKILQGIQNGDNATTVNQTETGIKSTATDGKNTASTNLSNKGFNTYATDGTNKTYTKQTATDIKNTAENGTISNSAKDLVNTATGDITNTAKNGTITNEAKDLVNKASGDMTNTVGGKLLNDVTGDMENKVGGNLTTTVTGDVTEDYKSNLSTTVGGNQTTTVTGDSSLTAENINNEAKNKITNTALDVETDASSSIVSKVSNDAGSNTSTQLSYQTTEKMSQADGKTASYLRGAAEEKSQLTDGDKKTTIDTVAGQTNTNITDGTNTSNNLQKADQAASSVTDGTNTTVVNQDAKSLASSITDGAKVNNTNSTVDKSEQLIKADDTHYYAETKTAGSAVEALKSDVNTIIIAKDAATGTVSSAVTDGATITGISQNAKDINLSAADGTIANSAKNISNTAAKKLSNSAEEIENTASKSIISQIGNGTAVKSEMTVEGIANKATGKSITNDAATITNTGTTSVTNQVGENKVLVDTTHVQSAFGDTIYTTWNESGITDKVGENVERTMGTSKITESVKNGTKSNTFTKTADKDINIVTDGTKSSTESQLADSVNTSLKEVDAEGKTTKSLNNVKTVSDDTTKITDTTKNAFSSSSQKADSITSTVKDMGKGTISERSQTVSQVQDKVGTTTVTTTDGLTKLTNEVGTHKTEMDFADVLKDLGVRGNATVDGNTTLGKEGADTTLTVNSTSTFNKDVTMKSNATVEKDLTVKGDAIIGTDANNTFTVNSKSTFNNGVTVKGGTTTDTLKVTGSSEFGGAATFNGEVTFKEAVSMDKDLSVGGNVDAASYTVKGTDIKIDENGINAGNQVIKNVGQGKISEGSTDAVSGGQLYETNTRVSGLETRMGTVETKVDKLDNKIDKVGANAAAMANLHPLEFDEDSKWNIAAAVGSSGSETASAVGVFYRPNENVMVNASAAMGTGENMFGGGVSLRLGHGGNKAKEAQMKAAAKENRELRAKVDDLTARMDALLSVLNPNMSKDFPDVPENHWAYEAVSRLAGNGIVEGYEDGKYHGERQMTRYEMAEIIYNALSKGAKAEKKLVEEFRPELQAMAAQKKA